MNTRIIAISGIKWENMWIILTLITLSFPYLIKYSYVISNQYSQIPIILSFLDKTYLINDWYVNISREFGPRTIYAWYMAQTAKIMSLPLSFYLHYLIYTAILGMATYKLSIFIVRNKYIALLTTISILFGNSITLGGNILVTQDFSAPQLPLSLTLLAIYFMFVGKFFISSLIFSLATYLHPLIGAESFTIFFLSFVWYLRKKRKIKNLLLKSFIPYVLFSLPLIYLYFSSYESTGISAITKIDILAYMRNPHHYLASTFSISQYLYFSLFIGLFFIIINKNNNKFNQIFVQLSKPIVLTILSFCFMGILSTEIFGFYPFTLLQPFRMTLYLYWLAAITIFSYAFFSTLSGKSLIRRLPLVIPLFFTKLSLLPNLGKIGYVSFIFGISLIFIYGKISKWVYIFLLVLYFSLFQFHQKFNYDKYFIQPTPETALAEWTEKNTSIDSVFIIPPQLENFRLVAQRAIIADWKAFPFQEGAMIEWARRICDLGNHKECNYNQITQEDIIKGYKSHTYETFIKLINKYQVNYLVTENLYEDLKMIYSNNKYYLYEVSEYSSGTT